jgi:hypothetical protein
MLPAVLSRITGSVALLLPQPLLGAAPAPLFLPADFITLLLLWGFCSTELLLQAIGQETPGQEAVEPLRAAALDLHGEPRRPMHEAHTGRGLVHMLSTWARRTDEGLLQILLMDLESPQSRLKHALFFRTDAELAHLCIHRLHGDNVTSQGIALPERLKGQLDILEGEDAVDDGLDTALRHQVHGLLQLLLSGRAGAHNLPFVAD